MKETSGEFSMTVVVIIGAIILVGLLSTLMPSMSNLIKNKWESMIGTAEKNNQQSNNNPLEEPLE